MNTGSRQGVNRTRLREASAAVVTYLARRLRL